MTTPHRSVRLLSKNSTELNSLSGESGEIFYDSTTKTLRLYDGATVGGKVVGTTNVITLANGSVIKDTAGQAVSFGVNAGKTTQGAYAVAIGLSAGEVNQASLAVAVGTASGLTNQGQAGVAIGYQAGQTGQGDSAVAIGRAAGKTNQAANSIVINATGSSLNNTTADSLVIAPIRSATATANVLYYNTTSKEVTYAGLTITANSVGLGNVTNESKTTMFTGPTFTGTVAATTINATTINATTVNVGGVNVKSLAIAMAAALS